MSDKEESTESVQPAMQKKNASNNTPDLPSDLSATTSKASPKSKDDQPKSDQPKHRLGNKYDLEHPEQFFANKICPVTGLLHPETFEPAPRDTGPLRTAYDLGWFRKPTPAEDTARQMEVNRLAEIEGRKEKDETDLIIESCPDDSDD